jgi:hypothetical protein
VTTSKYASLVQFQGERAASKDHRVQALAENHHLVELGHHGLLQGAASRYPDRPESFRTVQLADSPAAWWLWHSDCICHCGALAFCATSCVGRESDLVGSWAEPIARKLIKKAPLWFMGRADYEQTWWL